MAPIRVLRSSRDDPKPGPVMFHPGRIAFYIFIVVGGWGAFVKRPIASVALVICLLAGVVGCAGPEFTVDLNAMMKATYIR